MYSTNQIVHDLDTNKPVRAYKTPRQTHYVACREDGGRGTDIWTGFFTDLKGAEELLHLGYISPAPCPDTHCHKCRQWRRNCHCGIQYPSVWGEERKKRLERMMQSIARRIDITSDLLAKQTHELNRLRAKYMEDEE